MHLARTGAFLRAARNARLTRPTVIPKPKVKIISHHHRSTRCASTATATAFPEQSVDLNKEVDPTKTEDVSVTDAAHRSFADALKSHPHGKIVKDAGQAGTNILGSPYCFDSTTNVNESILKLVGRKLYDNPDHPIAITRSLIESTFPSPQYTHHHASNPVVSTIDNFDVLGFPQDHPGRSRTDTYYVNSNTVLRTHSSAHQHAAFQSLNKTLSRNAQKGSREANYGGFTICADVFRRDSIDRTHFPVFHQMEGALVWNAGSDRAKTINAATQDVPKHTDMQVQDKPGTMNAETNPLQPEHTEDEVTAVVESLKRNLENLVRRIFAHSFQARKGETSVSHEEIKVRWVEAYFPFTSPSFELEVFWNGDWLELLGCGVVKQNILDNAGLKESIGWAWGIGLERLAMLLFQIPDIRLLWSEDERFLSQFKAGQFNRFVPFSKYPPCHKDVSFWVQASPATASPVAAETSGAAAAAGGDATKASPSETQPAAFHENDIMEIVRDVAGTLVEDVKLVDEFVHPRSGKKSLCYRINYRSNERTLTNEEVNDMHENVISKMRDLPIQIR